VDVIEERKQICATINDIALIQEKALQQYCGPLSDPGECLSSDSDNLSDDAACRSDNYWTSKEPAKYR